MDRASGVSRAIRRKCDVDRRSVLPLVLPSRPDAAPVAACVGAFHVDNRQTTPAHMSENTTYT